MFKENKSWLTTRKLKRKTMFRFVNGNFMQSHCKSKSLQLWSSGVLGNRLCRDGGISVGWNSQCLWIKLARPLQDRLEPGLFRHTGICRSNQWNTGICAWYRRRLIVLPTWTVIILFSRRHRKPNPQTTAHFRLARANGRCWLRNCFKRHPIIKQIMFSSTMVLTDLAGGVLVSMW